MKTLFFLGLFVGQVVFAEVVSTALVVEDSNHEIELEMNAESVQCLIGDYGVGSLKVVVPQLKRLARLDHTSRGAPGPCITAGMCDLMGTDGVRSDSRLPLLINPLKPTETVTVNVLKQEVYELNTVDQSCVRSFAETITSEIKGITFRHYASMPLASVSFEICQKIVAASAK